MQLVASLCRGRYYAGSLEETEGEFRGRGGEEGLDKGKRRGKGDGEEMERRGMYGEIKMRGKGEEMERRERNKGKRRGTGGGRER